MKHFLASAISLSLLLFPTLSVGDEVNPNADPKPCRIMVDQIKAFLKIDPRKGYSEPYVTDWTPDKYPAKNYLFRRAFAPGIGKALLLDPSIVVEDPTTYFAKYLDEQKMRFSAEFISGPYNNIESMFDDYPAVVYDLSKSSGYIVMASIGGTSHCIGNYTFKIIQKDGYRELQESGPDFDEAELCRPSDFTIMQIEGKDYTLVNNTTITGGWWTNNTNNGGFIFDIHLYPMGFLKDYNYSYDDPKTYKPTCKIEARFTAIDGEGGVLKKISATP